MQGILETAKAAFAFVLLLLVGWSIVFFVGSVVERKLRRDQKGTSIWSSFAWVWDHANMIGIPVLIVGTLYIFWALNYSSGPGSETLLILLLMAAAGMLIGFAPSLRRR
ncbi:MAG TPA: hypothetical protein VFH48_16070 [Chloroflexota bacterium]|nr:hypothetical protein [Chloroflexota bacterium]